MSLVTGDTPLRLEPGCSLCDIRQGAGGVLLRETSEFRIVLVEGAEAKDYPGFCRVIWKSHVKEMTELPESQQIRLFSAVLAVEKVLRTVFKPHKINLASLGNMTPHLHWHIIPRYTTDATFPQAIWAQPTPNRHVVMSQFDYKEKTRLLQEGVLALHFDCGA
jgi:diadenosine tetraphosphate (Ap4A) HIT family hydrolase